MNSRIKGIQRRFFLASLSRYMLMLLLPMILLSLIVGWVVGNEVPQIIRNHSESLFEVSSLGLETLFKEVYQIKTFIEANPEVHLSLLQYLQNEEIDEKVRQGVTKLVQYLETTRFSRNYLHSIYITKQNTPYILVNGERIPFSQLLDTSWIDYYTSSPEKAFYIFNRNLKAFSFEQQGVSVITIIYVTKYRELIIVNLSQSFFSEFLQALTHHEKEAIWVTDSNGLVLTENWYSSHFVSEEVKKKAYFAGCNNSDFEDKYQLTLKGLDNETLIMFSLIPKEVLHASTRIIFYITIAASIFVTLLAFLFSWFFTKKSYAQINRIIGLFETNSQYSFDLKISHGQKDLYYYILEQIVSLYTQQASLQSDLLQQSYDLMKTKMAALQYQINPHFIFNTLQMIDIQISKDLPAPALANQMIQDFSALLRYSLDDPTGVVPLVQEIKMAKTYLQLLQYRNSDSIKAFWYYDYDLIISYPSLRMIFQPLLENVVRHGCKKAFYKPIIVRIRIVQRIGYLLVSVIDNGCGVSPDRLQQIQHQIEEGDSEIQRQIGLLNVNTRLKLAFSEASSLRVYSKEGHGFAVFFRIPNPIIEEMKEKTCGK